MPEVFAGLPPEVREVLASAPEDHTMAVDLRLAWGGLTEAHAHVVERLQVTVTSRDPLGWLEGRGEGSAAGVGRGPGHRVLLCLHLPALLARAEVRGTPLADRVAELAATVVSSAAEHEAALTAGTHARMVARGRLPDLLTPTLGASAVPRPGVVAASGGWAPVDSEVLVAVVEAAFGPVELDRRPVLLSEPSRHQSGCPGCDGVRLGFPEELVAAQDRLCLPHRSEAVRLANERFARAERRNPQSWRALWRAERRAHRPRLEIGGVFADRLSDAVERATAPTLAELHEEAELALELAEHYAGDPDRFVQAREADWELHEWILNLPRELADAGLVDEAVEVADVLGDVDRDHATDYAADAALVLARAGRTEEALARVELNVSDFPRDPTVMVQAAEACVAAGAAERAELLLRQAVAVARERGDPEEVSGAYENLIGFLTLQGGRARDVNRVRRERDAWSRDTGWIAVEADWTHEHAHPVVTVRQPVRRAGPKVGRNDPCPCGSGRKHKRCCGRVRPLPDT